jgi:osmotically-inducible protein OsmY
MNPIAARARHTWVLLAALALACACSEVPAQDKGPGFDDAMITERVTSALERDPVLKDMHISVETRDGVVHLKGFVDSVAQVERAAELARRVEGVTSVRNTVRVANRPSRA